jgi:anaerobic selenocysteine-containing dehydrogenase
MSAGAESFIARVLATRGSKYASFRITIPKEYATFLGLKEGDWVRVTIKKVRGEAKA